MTEDEATPSEEPRQQQAEDTHLSAADRVFARMSFWQTVLSVVGPVSPGDFDERQNRHILGLRLQGTYE